MPNSQDIYQQANQLPPFEKLRLAELLLANMDVPDPTIDAIWHDETHAVIQGSLEPESGEA